MGRRNGATEKESMKQPKYIHSFEVVRRLPAPLEGLTRLASNFRWSWNHAARDIFRAIDKTAWLESGHNPIAFLNDLDSDRVEKLASDEGFVTRVNDAVTELDNYLKAETWFDTEFPGMREGHSVAYFCFEFGLTEGLPIYSGGLGVLAGDHLKASSDLGLPLVGIGLLYNRGYFRQRLTYDGWQQEIYPTYDFTQMPITLIRNEDGTPVTVSVEFPDRTVTLQIWRADVGRIPLYLLDSNVLENQADDKSITDSLYSGDEEMRIRQEMILGIGGYKAIRALGIKPTVCHMNEGHAAFLSMERIRQTMVEESVDFRTARAAVVHGNVFTTHTPVPAGFDLFRPELLERYLGRTVSEVGLGFQEFLRLGRINPNDNGTPFNMAVLAMETANRVNGVAKLHAKVTRTLFSDRWSDWPEDEVPIGAVTNGIHTMTWISRRFAALFDEYLGTEWRRRPDLPENWEGVENIPDEDLWLAMEAQRGDLVRYVRKKLGTSQERVDYGVEGQVLDPRVLTVGFARRFATYKRGSLMLSDRDRLKALLFHADRPVQIVVSGKAHPRDDGGKHIIQDLYTFINEDGARARMVFLEDYDMGVARQLVQGVDVWLNNPRRPHEASGTSGMKVVPNAGLNVSILDGWWDEAYDPEVGWAIGDRGSSQDEGHQDWLDGRALYHLLETDVAPLFYQRDADNIPRAWVKKAKASIRHLAGQFSTARMVADYATACYVPAMKSFEEASKNGLNGAKEALQWRDKVSAGWNAVKVLSVHDTASRRNDLGKTVQVTAEVDLGSLTPEDVKVQALVGKVGNNRDLTQLRTENLALKGGENGRYTFVGTVLCDLAGHQGYLVRIVPSHEGIPVPAALQLIRWESA
ncbi:glycosyltransferase family 1 protein [soil metagenome]